MRKLFILSLTLLISISSFAQKEIVKNNDKPVFTKISPFAPQKADKMILNENKGIKSYDIPVGIPIGLTKYDLQSNSAVAKRIINHDDGTISVVWTQDQSTPPGGATRGTGYNYFDGSSWLYTSMSGDNRIEDTRTGWPTLMSNGTEEFVANHVKTTPGMFGWKQTKGANETGWTSSEIVGGPEAMLWPRATSSGDYYYVIGVDDYEGDDQTTIEGLHIYISDDAGTSWTYGGKMPNYNTYYHHGQGDIYAIDAKDNYVAVVNFDDFGDMVLWKSDDNGSTWTETIINDFPVDAYDGTAGTIIDMDTDGVADTIMTSDQTGDVLIDANGLVHVVFSRMRNLDIDAGDDGAKSYFPYTDYLLYWNEDMGAGTYTDVESPSSIDMAVPAAVDTLGWSFDLTANDTIWEFAEVADGEWPFGTYFTSLTSFSSMGIDDLGNIYVAFTTVMEGDNYVSTEAQPNDQSFRGVWVTVKLAENGEWTTPVNISDVDGTTAENVFPTLARNVDEYLHLWIQWDGEPGLHIRGDEDNATDNYIVYKKLSAEGIVLGINDLESSSLELDVYPNPATEYISISNVRNGLVTIYNILGAEVYSANFSENSEINISNLKSGTYFVKVKTEDSVLSTKLIIK